MKRLAPICVICAICGCSQPAPPPATPTPPPPITHEFRVRIVITDPTWKQETIQKRIDVAQAIYAERGWRFTVTSIGSSNRPELITVEDRDLPVMLRETSAVPDPIAVFCGDIYVSADEDGSGPLPSVLSYYGGIGYPLPAKLLVVAKVSCEDVLAHEYGHVLCQDHVEQDGNTMDVTTCKATSRFTAQQAASMLACASDRKRATARITDLKPFVCKGRK